MSLNLKELIEHENKLQQEIYVIQERYKNINMRQEELLAVRVLIKREQERQGDSDEARTKYQGKTAEAAVELFFRNGAEGWADADLVTGAIREGGLVQDTLRNNVGMALVSLYRKKVLDRRNISKTGQPKYEYYLKE